MCVAIRKTGQALKGEDQLSGEEERSGKSKTAVRSFIRLPKVELPHFSGDVREWEAFYELFTNLIHENPDLSNTEKLYYLMGSLKGQAKNVCAGIAMTGDNYEIVWDALIERYHDTRALAKTYLNQILEWKDSREESEKGLVTFLEKFDTSVRALRKLKLRDLADFILLHHALARLNPETANYFELSRQSGSVPLYEELSEFIKLRVKTLSTPKQLFKGKELEHAKVKSSSRTFMVNKPGLSRSVSYCEYCRKLGHWLSSCSAFLNLNPKKRYAEVKRLNLCYNCFAIDHGVRGCQTGSRCDFCNAKHHTLIHRDKAVVIPARSVPQERALDCLIG